MNDLAPSSGHGGTLDVSQHSLAAISGLIHWIEGFQAAGKGNVPGHFELIMLYRQLVSLPVSAPAQESQP